MKKTFFISLTFMMFVFITFNALAEYPTRPVKIVVAFRAGGSSDTVVRVFAKALSKELGKPVIVSNTAGAGGSIGAGHLKRERADGYTLGANWTGAFTINPALRKTNYSISDFDYINTFSISQPAFVVAADKPWQTWQDLMIAGRKAGSLTCATQTSWEKFAIQSIKKREGFSIEAVPTKGGGEMIPAILGGHVDFAFSWGIHYQYVASGKMRVLSAATSDRLVAFPDAPTLNELGYNMSADTSILLLAPKGLPAQVKDILAKATKKAFHSTEVQSLLKDKLHLKPFYIAGNDIVQLITKDAEAFKKVVDNAGK